jgi:hypothetical protein
LGSCAEKSRLNRTAAHVDPALTHHGQWVELSYPGRLLLTVLAMAPVNGSLRAGQTRNSERSGGLTGCPGEIWKQKYRAEITTFDQSVSSLLKLS